MVCAHAFPLLTEHFKSAATATFLKHKNRLSEGMNYRTILNKHGKLNLFCQDCTDYYSKCRAQNKDISLNYLESKSKWLRCTIIDQSRIP